MAMEKEGNVLTDRVAIGKQLGKLWHRAIISQAMVFSALQIADAIPALEEPFARDHETGQTGLPDLLPEFKILTPFDAIKDLPVIARMLAKQTVVNAEVVIAVASVILSHSTADDVFTETCRAAMVLDPEKWIAELNLDRTVSLRDLNKKGRDGVFETEIESLRKNVGAKSLPTRAALLFAKVAIKQHAQLTRTDPSYFTMPRLKEADDLRNEIVHGGQLPTLSIANSRVTTSFLHEACYTALRSVLFSYKIPVDYADIVGAPIDKLPQ